MSSENIESTDPRIVNTYPLEPAPTPNVVLGNPPLPVDAKKKGKRINADMVDGKHASVFLQTDQIIVASITDAAIRYGDTGRPRGNCLLQRRGIGRPAASTFPGPR